MSFPTLIEIVDEYKNKIITLNAELRKYRNGLKHCKWKKYEGWESGKYYGRYRTGCSMDHVFIDGDFEDNRYKYCPYCGLHIIESTVTYKEVTE